MRVTKNSSPAILRLTAPGSFFSSMSSCVCFHSSTWCSNITGCVADLDLQLGHQLAADVVGHPGEGLVVDDVRDRLGQVHRSPSRRWGAPDSVAARAPPGGGWRAPMDSTGALRALSRPR